MEKALVLHPPGLDALFSIFILQQPGQLSEYGTRLLAALGEL